jgi:hypothetical protein
MANEKDTQQGASYPYMPLPSALTVAEAVKQLGGNKTPVPKSLLASTLKEDIKSQGFTFRIASTKCFGLIEGRSAYTLTENAKRYFFPTSTSDKIEASLSFLQSPSGFAEIIKRFDGQKLPETQMLANIFHTQLRVPESWSVRAATFFLRSAQHVGVVDEQGFLRFDAAKHIGSKESPVDTSAPETPPPASQPPGSQPAPPPDKPGTQSHTLYLDKAKARPFSITGPIAITRPEYQRICKWIEFALIVEDENGQGSPK